MAEPKLVITGTGRAGTTLLVQILDALGLDTGLEDGKLTAYGPSVRAGLECRVDDPDGPRVVKDMTLGHRIRPVLETGEVHIEHVIIPQRRLDIAAASRIRAAGYGRLPFRRGALTGTLRPGEQQEILARMHTDIVTALTEYDIPYTVIEFPRFALDAPYAFETLGFVAPTATIDDFAAALAKCVRPDLIHEEPLTTREVWRTRVTSAWMRFVRLPLARVRNRIDPEGAQARLKASVAAERRREAMIVERDGLPGHSAGDR